ncbi:MAG: GNAT family N-acetyltransferase [Peptoanaerobacter stomatis]|uniref:GNAT family N-acetyltransferase n=1 Tax=Peptoanaerobacter stomatis TaxID=796937 RepID=UPI003FA08B13
MNIDINFVKIKDAKEIIEYCKQVGSETNNLSFGSEGLGISVSEEERIILSFLQDKKSMMFVARHNGKIVGLAAYRSMPRRFSHRADIGISILKDYWGNKIATRLIETMLDFAQNVARSKVISLEVATDNIRAIRLYEKFGFEKIGLFKKYFKVGDEFLDAYIMTLYL